MNEKYITVPRWVLVYMSAIAIIVVFGVYKYAHFSGEYDGRELEGKRLCDNELASKRYCESKFPLPKCRN